MQVDLSELSRAAHKLKVRVAVDGPAGAGKSTIGRGLADALHCTYLDTGLMYRAITWLALGQAIDLSDAAALAALARSTSFSFDAERTDLLLVDGLPLSTVLRTPEVDAAVSQVSAHAEVRHVLVANQRALACGRCIVMVGRDIGTTVLPDAEIKLWVTASAEERARRRLLEQRATGSGGSPEEMMDRIRARDAYDANRAVSPLRAAPDAIEIDTGALTRVETLGIALSSLWSYIQRRQGISA